jgi:pre-mRNA-splicing factor CWC22
MLDIFQYDPEYDENEKHWALIKAEILGESKNPNENEFGNDDDDEENEEINQQLQMQEENKNVKKIRK